MCSTMSQTTAAASATAPVTPSGSANSSRMRVRALTFGRSQNFACAVGQYASGSSFGSLAQVRRGRRTMAYREGGSTNCEGGSVSRDGAPFLRDRDDRVARLERIASTADARRQPAADAASRVPQTETGSLAPIAAAVTTSATPPHITAGTVAARAPSDRSLGRDASQSRGRWVANRFLRRRVAIANAAAERAATRIGSAAASTRPGPIEAKWPSAAQAVSTRAAMSQSSGQRRRTLHDASQPVRNDGRSRTQVRPSVRRGTHKDTQQALRRHAVSIYLPRSAIRSSPAAPRRADSRPANSR